MILFVYTRIDKLLIKLNREKTTKQTLRITQMGLVSVSMAGGAIRPSLVNQTEQCAMRKRFLLSFGGGKSVYGF